MSNQTNDTAREGAVKAVVKAQQERQFMPEPALSGFIVGTRKGFDAGVAHATQWVRISESGLPEEGQTVAFIVESSDKYSNGLVLGGRYKDGYFNVPGCGYQASHWMPLPPPCEIESKTEARLKEIRSVKHGSSKDVLVGGEK